MSKKIMSYSDLAENQAYELAYEEYLADTKTAGIVLRHKKSGARVCVLANDDENKVFCAGFRTTPTDSTGVPHIIEHTVLNGSKNYPSRDPFMQLAKGSMKTFLNAITWPDKTMYPVASCNDKDFTNLMHVYLDAVFFPNIYKKREIFMQEGWHYELDAPEDELTINGVVYSEMKGAMSSPDRTIYDEIFNSILPDTTYGVNSGGDPEVIPTLTYENYLDFHRRYYHPSNSYIFIYGNADMDERLEFLDREYLSQFDAISPDSDVARQPHFGDSSPKRVTVKYPVGSEDETENKTFFALASLAGPSADALECGAYGVLSDVLINSDSAPVKNALMDAGIGEEIYGGFEQAADQVFTVIAKNANAADADRFYDTVIDTLKREVENGINEKAILANLNRAEFKFREAAGGGVPLGLSQIITMMDSWLYDDSAAFSYMHTLDTIAALKAKIGTGYYEELIRKYVLESDHSVLLTMAPEKGLVEKRENALKEKLAAYKASLSADEIDAIVASTKALREYQSAPETEEERNCIPTLERSDIKREADPFCSEERTIDGTPAVFHAIDTNGITYLSLLFDASDLPVKYAPYIGLLADILASVDTEKHSYTDIDIETKLNTGDVDLYPVTYSHRDGSYCVKLRTFVSAMPDKLEYALTMLAEVMTSSKFDDKKRISAILGEIRSDKQRSIISSGSSVASSRAISYFSEEACWSQAFEGLDYYFFIKDLHEHIDEKAAEIAENLRKVAAFVFDPARLSISLGCDDKGYAEIERLLPAFKAELDKIAHESLGERGKFVPERKNEGIMIPSQVQYVARAGSFKDAGIKDSGAFNVARIAVNTDYLYQKIRVRGGAYGCGVQLMSNDGMAAFYTYRDPNLASSDEVFKGTGEFVRTHEFDEKELTKYIIGTFSGFDAPLSPQAKINRSFMAYMTGTTIEDINRRRAEALDITEADFRAAGEMFDAVCAQDYFCVVGSEKSIRDNKEMFGAIVSI